MVHGFYSDLHRLQSRGSGGRSGAQEHGFGQKNAGGMGGGAQFVTMYREIWFYWICTICYKCSLTWFSHMIWVSLIGPGSWADVLFGE